MGLAQPFRRDQPIALVGTLRRRLLIRAFGFGEYM